MKLFESSDYFRQFDGAFSFKTTMWIHCRKLQDVVKLIPLSTRLCTAGAKVGLIRTERFEIFNN